MKISGQVTYKANFDIEIDMTVNEFSRLSESKQNQIIENHIDPTLVDYYDTEISDDIDY